MEPFRMDFAMQRGHEMLLDRETGIVRAELDELELSMLQAADMPRLLKMDWYDLDGRITFRYVLAGKRMLSHRLQTGPFTMRQYYQLMLTIVEALDDCKHYMLRSEAILLHEHYMYVGEAWSDIGLAYMPLREEPEQPVRERLMALAVRWTIHVEQVNGAGLQRMLRELGTSSADWTGIRELLLELTALAALPDAARVQKQQIGAVEPSTYVQSKARPAAVQSRMDAQPSLRREQDLRPPAAASPSLDVKAASWHGSPKPSAAAIARDPLDLPAPESLATKQPEGVASRRKIIIGAIVAVAAALVWRYGYMDAPTMQRAMFCGGLTLLMAAAGYWVWRRSDSAEETKLEAESAIEQEIRDYEVEQSAWRWGGWERQQEEAEAAPAVPASGPVSVPVSSIIASATEAGGSAAGWQVPDSPVNPPTVPAPLPGSEETVLLGAASMTAQLNGHSEAYLERLWEGRAERVPLSGGRFVIGRSGENADYVDASSGLSRSHLEILKEKAGYAAKDLGSRNGSLLNGESMIPYKLYQIQPGDQLQLAGSHGAVYTFQGH
ncbi:DUF6382 domain-containing protein [Paenibacillus sp. 1P07SE]|uniref:DUF6382 domain-containing protein n=1 Tax=Paenibacillus sp. 1P07SE TaxID=3132209 RepID=UPI0039A489DF